MDNGYTTFEWLTGDRWMDGQSPRAGIFNRIRGRGRGGSCGGEKRQITSGVRRERLDGGTGWSLSGGNGGNRGGNFSVDGRVTR